MAGENERSIADLIQEIIANVQAIIRSEVRLAKTEVTEEATKAARASGLMAGGAVAALFTVWLLLLTIVYALATAMPIWAAALILFVVMAGLSFTLMVAGKKRIKTVRAKPERTIETMKENVEWVKNHTR